MLRGEPVRSCGGKTSRTHRRARDHVTSLLAPVRRYRCTRLSCGWEGNWRVGSESAARHRKQRLPLVFLASMLFIGATALVAVAYGLLEMMPGLQRSLARLFSR